MYFPSLSRMSPWALPRLERLRARLSPPVSPPVTPLCFASVAAIMFIPLFAPVFAAEGRAGSILDPAEIDRAVQAFTGVPVGEIGGARAPADRRLQLAQCAEPLATSWHGTSGAAVRVECGAAVGDASGWRIFVATRPAPSGAPAGATNQASTPLIKRGDPVTVIVRGRGFSIQQSGEATESGSIGDWIGVRTARQAEPVRARIERPGLAVIPVG